MTKSRPADEIDREVTNLKYVLGWSRPDHLRWLKASIQIDVLRGDLDFDSSKFSDLSDVQQMAAMDAQNWLEGHVENPPSSVWRGELAG